MSLNPPITQEEIQAATAFCHAMAAAQESGDDEGLVDNVILFRREAQAELLAACKAALPNLRWANCHGSRCDEDIAQVEAAVAKAKVPSPNERTPPCSF